MNFTRKNVQNYKISRCLCHIWIPHVKCIKISKNSCSIGSVILEIAPRILEQNSTFLHSYSSAFNYLSVKQYYIGLLITRQVDWVWNGPLANQIRGSVFIFIWHELSYLVQVWSCLYQVWVFKVPSYLQQRKGENLANAWKIQGILKGESGLFWPVLTLWGSGHFDGHIWGRLIVPLDLEQLFGTISKTYRCRMFAITLMCKKGNTH